MNPYPLDLRARAEVLLQDLQHWATNNLSTTELGPIERASLDALGHLAGVRRCLLAVEQLLSRKEPSNDRP